MSTARILKSEVPGWGADLDLKNRPAVPREANRESVLDQHGGDYDRIPRQVPRVKILVSSEHLKLTPVFGTSCPPHGLSGKLRELAFRFSEGKKAHWLILMAADRVDVVESALANLIRLRSHNPLAEMGIKTEFRRGGFFSRFGHHRADTRRWRQELLLGGVVIAGGVWAIRALLRRRDLDTVSVTVESVRVEDMTG
jgi:hypothetical protein